MMTHTPKKSLGQNFLRDDAVIARIVRESGARAGDVVVEVGPGDGALTAALAQTGARVVAVEVDQDLLAPLRARFAAQPTVQIVQGDIRRINLPALLAQQGVQRYTVVANIPYYITASIVRLFLESATPPAQMVLMVQEEVARRICAQPGAMSVLSVAVRYYGVPTYLFGVPATAFVPVPQVNSAVVRIALASARPSRAQAQAFFRVVRAGFSARRKMLVNNLANSLHMDKADAQRCVTQCDLAPTVRAQEVSVAQWRCVVAHTQQM